MEYDFSQLNDKEFEQFSIDLLSKLYNIRIERFKPGKDGGVDGRFFANDNREVIIQCKHYLKSSISKLLKTLINEELTKVKKIDPKRYILVTSLPLSRDNKIKIKEIFDPYIKQENDIFGCEDLNDLLSHYSDIEEKYYKLWITSTTILKRILHSAIVGRSEFHLEYIKKKKKRFVTTCSYEKANNKLQKENVIIITGEPGIGKTTLAENLCLHFCAHGYEYICIENSLSEAEAVFDPDKKQVFYFDDFLGSSYFEAIENKIDSHIMKFIHRIQANKSKKFILTSRTNILNLGVTFSSNFTNQNLTKNEFLIEVKDLIEFEKAQILYNHIYFSNLSKAFINEIYKDKRYLKIINHRNFNPRIIEFITDNDRIQTVPKEYWSSVEQKLDNPIDIWDHCFKSQNNIYSRCLVLLVAFNVKSIPEKNLKDSYKRYITLTGVPRSTTIEYDFNTIIKLAMKAFLNRNKKDEEIYYTLFNPSIYDYLIKEYHDNNELSLIFEALQSRESLNAIFNLYKNQYISEEMYWSLLSHLYNRFKESIPSVDYILKIIDYRYQQEKDIDFIVKLISNIIKEDINIDEESIFLKLLADNLELVKMKNLNYLFDLVKYHTFSENDALAFIKIYKKYRDNFYEYNDEFIEIMHEFMVKEIDEIIDNIDIFEYDITHENSMGDEFDSDQLEDDLENYISERIDHFKLNDFSIYDFDFREYINATEIFSSKIKGKPYEDEPRYYNSSSVGCDIEDLFERT